MDSKSDLSATVNGRVTNMLAYAARRLAFVKSRVWESITARHKYGPFLSRDREGVPMGLPPIKMDEGGAWGDSRACPGESERERL